MTSAPVPSLANRPEVVCLGESMTMLTATTALPLRSRPTLAMYVGGAESNVACGLAHLGHKVEWHGRLGDDPLGRGIADFLESRSVDTSRVEYDGSRGTGIYFKDRAEAHTTVYYYRTNSAASAMSRANMELGLLEDVRLLHLSGITAALSESCDHLMDALLVERKHGASKVSFDINYRSGLWPVDKAAPRLRALALAADIVIVGRDEAEKLWGTKTADDVRDLLRGVPELVVKDSDVGATHYSAKGTAFEPALKVQVVEPVGAGDAFAAGFLSGSLKGMSPGQSLRHGHVMAAFTLQHESDLPELPDAQVIAGYSRLHGRAWSDLDLSRAPRLQVP